MAITIWLSLIECKEAGLIQGNKLALGDNTIAISLIKKTSKMGREDLRYGAAKLIAPKISKLMAESGNFLDSQHLKGKLNGISDWLTFEDKEQYKKGKAGGQWTQGGEISNPPNCI